MAKKSSPQDKLINLQAQQLAAQVANWAAQLEFQKERLRLLELPEMQHKTQLDIDRLAFDKGQAAWENAFKEASITGTYQGQPTTEWLTQQAQLTGVLNGQQTLQGKLTDAQVRQMNDQMKLANDEFVANTTGYFNGQKTFDRQKFEAAQASDAWKFIASLTGPANAFKQARAIGSMPGGMRDLMNSWAGQYAAPGSTSVGTGGRSTLASLIGEDSGYNVQPQPGYGGGQPGQGPQQPPAAAPIQMPSVPAPVPEPVQAPTQPQPTQPQPTQPAPTSGIPGRGFNMTQWNAATHAAAVAWNAAHPGYYADGSQLGYFAVDANGTRIDNPPPPPEPGTGTGTGAGAGTGTPAGHTDTSVSTNAYTYQPAGVQAPAEAWNYSPTTTGSMSVYPPGVPSPADTPDVTSTSPLSPQVAQNLYHFGGQYTPLAPSQQQQQPVTTQVYDPYNAGVAADPHGTLLPNQINAKNYANTYGYQRELGWAGYEDQGWDKGLAQEAFQRSLPKYSGPKAGSYAF